MCAITRANFCQKSNPSSFKTNTKDQAENFKIAKLKDTFDLRQLLLCTSGRPGTHYVDLLASNSEKPTCLYHQRVLGLKVYASVTLIFTLCVCLCLCLMYTDACKDQRKTHREAAQGGGQETHSVSQHVIIHVEVGCVRRTAHIRDVRSF